MSARNCVPSLHFAWALLLCLNSKTAVAKTMSCMFLVVISMATLGLGEHYLVDLLIAVPFAVAIHRRDIKSAILVVFWIALIRSPFYPPLALSWLLGAGTVIVPMLSLSGLFQSRLFNFGGSRS